MYVRFPSGPNLPHSIVRFTFTIAKLDKLTGNCSEPNVGGLFQPIK